MGAIQVWAPPAFLEGVRRPLRKSFALDANLEDDAVVEISVVNGKRIIAPVVAQLWTLDELLAGINSDNIHHEINTGAELGREAW